MTTIVILISALSIGLSIYSMILGARTRRRMNALRTAIAHQLSVVCTDADTDRWLRARD